MQGRGREIGQSPQFSHTSYTHTITNRSAAPCSGSASATAPSATCGPWAPWPTRCSRARPNPTWWACPQRRRWRRWRPCGSGHRRWWMGLTRARKGGWRGCCWRVCGRTRRSGRGRARWRRCWWARERDRRRVKLQRCGRGHGCDDQWVVHVEGGVVLCRMVIGVHMLDMGAC